MRMIDLDESARRSILGLLKRQRMERDKRIGLNRRYVHPFPGKNGISHYLFERLVKGITLKRFKELCSEFKVNWVRYYGLYRYGYHRGVEWDFTHDSKDRLKIDLMGIKL